MALTGADVVASARLKLGGPQSSTQNQWPDADLAIAINEGIAWMQSVGDEIDRQGFLVINDAVIMTNSTDSWQDKTTLETLPAVPLPYEIRDVRRISTTALSPNAVKFHHTTADEIFRMRELIAFGEFWTDRIYYGYNRASRRIEFTETRPGDDIVLLSYSPIHPTVTDANLGDNLLVQEEYRNILATIVAVISAIKHLGEGLQRAQALMQELSIMPFPGRNMAFGDTKSFRNLQTAMMQSQRTMTGGES